MAILWLGFFLLSPNVLRFLSAFINPSFLFLPFVLIVLGLIQAYGNFDLKGRRRWFLAICLILSLSIQIHYTSLCFLGTLLTLELLAKERLGWRIYLAGATTFALPLTPYLLWSFSHRTWTEGGSFFDVLPTMADKIFITVTSDFKSLGSRAVSATLASVPLPLFSLCVAYVFGPQDKDEPNEPMRILLLCCLWSLPAFFISYFIPSGGRYVLPLTVSALLSIPWLAMFVLNSPKRLHLFVAVCAAMIVSIWLLRFSVSPFALFLIAILLVLALFGDIRRQTHRWQWLAAALVSLLLMSAQNDFVRSKTRIWKMRATDWESVWNYVGSRSSLTYDQLKTRIYRVNGNGDDDLQLSFPSEKKASIPSSDEPDGFIIGWRPRWRHGGTFGDWLLRHNIQEEIKRAYLANELVIEPPVVSKRLMIAAYKVKPKPGHIDTILPHHFHNISWGYLPPNWPQSRETRAFHPSPADFLFNWNECMGHAIECSSGISVHLNEKDNTAKIRVYGTSLSQLLPMVFPLWTQVWFHPYVEFQCDKKDRRIELLSSIGMDIQRAVRFHNTSIFSHNNSVMAPFEKEIEMPCAHPRAVRAGRVFAFAHRLSRALSLPASQLSVDDLIDGSISVRGDKVVSK